VGNLSLIQGKGGLNSWGEGLKSDSILLRECPGVILVNLEERSMGGVNYFLTFQRKQGLPEVVQTVIISLISLIPEVTTNDVLNFGN